MPLRSHGTESESVSGLGMVLPAETSQRGQYKLFSSRDVILRDESNEPN